MSTSQSPLDDPEAEQAPGRDVLAGSVVLVVCLWLWSVSLGFPTDPGTYVRLILGSIIVLSIVQILRAIILVVRARRSSQDAAEGHAATSVSSDDTAEEDGGEDGRRGAASDPGPAEPWHRNEQARGWIFVFASIIYVLLLPFSGYLVTTLAFLVGLVTFGIGWRWRAGLAIVVLVMVLYAMSVFVLNINMPRGMLL